MNDTVAANRSAFGCNASALQYEPREVWKRGAAGEAWAESVQKVAVADASDPSAAPLGHLYLDLYTRCAGWASTNREGGGAPAQWAPAHCCQSALKMDVLACCG